MKQYTQCSQYQDIGDILASNRNTIKIRNISWSQHDPLSTQHGPSCSLKTEHVFYNITSDYSYPVMLHLIRSHPMFIKNTLDKER